MKKGAVKETAKFHSTFSPFSYPGSLVQSPYTPMTNLINFAIFPLKFVKKLLIILSILLISVMW